ncbi:hypothetical protein Gotri_014833 [Gossypium trilobum]|uniref:GTD-binding domain-containing protein n=1 Tax=Gossypium trilobum TaxID=34281 RepID=A0A7J9DYT6_9ROSI|nr:hypothetical protein [Gossypium trilobum]
MGAEQTFLTIKSVFPTRKAAPSKFIVINLCNNALLAFFLPTLFKTTWGSFKPTKQRNGENPLRLKLGPLRHGRLPMILRLQSGKSSVEIDVIQFKRMAEQKQEYDQQVIESLQWIGMKFNGKLYAFVQAEPNESTQTALHSPHSVPKPATSSLEKPARQPGTYVIQIPKDKI